MDIPFATALAGWKASGKNRLGWTLVPNAADVDSAESMRIAAGVLDALGVSRDVTSAVPKDPGGPLEQAVCDHLREVLPGYRTGRDWLIGRSKLITGFDQYAPPEGGGCAGARQPAVAYLAGDGLPDQTGRHGGPGRSPHRLGPAATARGDLRQVDHPVGPGAEHQARVPADDPAPARQATAPGNGDRGAAAAGWRPSPAVPARWMPCTTSPTARWTPASPSTRTLNSGTPGGR